MCQSNTWRRFGSPQSRFPCGPGCRCVVAGFVWRCKHLAMHSYDAQGRRIKKVVRNLGDLDGSKLYL